MNAVFEPIRIQSATEADLEFVLKAENDESNRKFIIPWTLEKHSQALANPDMATFIVFSTDSNERVGHAIVAGLQNENQSVEFMRVVITQKGRGYGRKVLQSIKQLAFEEWRCHRLWLDVKENNVRAKTLYESEGFVMEGRLRECLKTGDRFETLIVLSMLETEYRSTV